jgi:hypothetical protein
MRSLGRLVRGLSALFWGLPAAFLVCYHTARADTLRLLGVLPPMVCTGLLVYGLVQLSGFQRQERVWRKALDRATLIAIVNFFLSPFLYWWNRMPDNLFYIAMVMLMGACALLLLASVNLAIQRLNAMLPDEALRQETRQFTALNLNLLLVIAVLSIAYLAAGFVDAQHLSGLPLWLERIAMEIDQSGFWFLLAILLILLLPLAITMALLWKTKEVILDGIFGAK